MKKLLLALSVCICMLCACGAKEQPEQPASPTVTPTEVPAPTVTSTPAPTPTDVPTPVPTATPEPTATPTEVPKSPLDIVRETLEKEDALCGVAFLGYFEGEYLEVRTEWERAGLFETYPFLQGITEEQVILTSGGEWFLLLPVAEDVKVSVYENTNDYEDFLLKQGKELYSSAMGTPILIRGNISDIYPSTVVVLEKDTRKIEYSPFLSLKDGSLAVGEGITNIG